MKRGRSRAIADAVLATYLRNTDIDALHTAAQLLGRAAAPESTSEIDLMTGRTVGKYRILAPLGRGATGVVYRALDQTLEREVAIKVLIRDLAEPSAMQRFRAEATTLAHAKASPKRT